jgi:hypothetical protein
VVRFNATTLWHTDAVEWAPSTASKADMTGRICDVRFVPKADIDPAIYSLIASWEL